MKLRRTLAFSVLIILIFILVLINFSVGSVDIKGSDIVKLLLNRDTTSVQGAVLINIRIPRVIEAMLLGGCLALSGYLLQAFFANPIAGPFVLGISSGAKLVVACLMVMGSEFGFGISSGMMVSASFVGALLATGFVIAAAGKVKNMSVLIVCGIMIGYIASAVTEVLVTFADDYNIVNLHNWSLGTFSSSSWQEIKIVVIITILGVFTSLFLSKQIEAYLFGENYAKSVGMNVRVFRICLILVSSFLSATVTAFAGPVSFVGIAVPHVIRRLLKTSKQRSIIMGAFLGGAVVCLFCDLLARALFAPMELSISTVTAVFGAPVVIGMMLNKKRA
ncbi:MAG: iron ABC transporter permease [Acetatifactor sp.]|nr:iron ABC transporter permease [Acetatifactor sp.]